jgi:hypothetical protein
MSSRILGTTDDAARVSLAPVFIVTWPKRRLLSTSLHKCASVICGACSPLRLCCCWEGINFASKSPYKVVPTKREREELELRADKYTLPHFMVARAQMILLARPGLSNDQIADRLGTRCESVSRWRKRLFESRLAGLQGFEPPGPAPSSPQSWSCRLSIAARSQGRTPPRLHNRISP